MGIQQGSIQRVHGLQWAHGMARWQSVAGQPFIVPREALFVKNGASLNGILVYWPTYWPGVVVQILAWSLAGWREFSVVASKEQDEKSFAEAEATWQKLQTAAKAQLPMGMNCAHF